MIKACTALPAGSRSWTARLLSEAAMPLAWRQCAAVSALLVLVQSDRDYMGAVPRHMDSGHRLPLCLAVSRPLSHSLLVTAQGATPALPLTAFLLQPKAAHQPPSHRPCAQTQWPVRLCGSHSHGATHGLRVCLWHDATHGWQSVRSVCVLMRGACLPACLCCGGCCPGSGATRA